MTKKSHIYFIDNYNFENYKQINGIHILKIKKDELIANSYLNGIIPYENSDNEDLYLGKYYNPVSLIKSDDPFSFKKLPNYTNQEFESFVKAEHLRYSNYDDAQHEIGFINFVQEYLFDLDKSQLAIQRKDENYLNSLLSIFKYGKLTAVDVLYYDSIVYSNTLHKIRYYDRIDQTFKSINKAGIKKILNTDKNYHYVVLWPTHLMIMNTFNEKQCEMLKKSYPAELRDLFSNELDNFPLGAMIGKLARVIKSYNNRHHSLNKDEIVYVLNHGKFQNSFKLLTATGEIKYANNSDLVCLPPKEQDSQVAINYQIQRKKLQYQEQENGFPLLLVINEITDTSITGTTPAGESIWIPRSIVPKLPVINKDHAAWIWVPLWWHEKKNA